MSTTLTDRYVWAVVRLLPDSQRPEIRDELTASIADMIDAQVPQGRSAEEVERQVLAEMGDPRRLAAKYVDRPRYLIGPDVFPYYVRALRILLLIVVPIVALASAFGKVLDDASAIEVIATASGAAIASAVQVCFWLTLVIAIVAPRPEGHEWSLDDLPEPPPPTRISLGDTIASVAFSAVTILVLVWQRFSSPFTAEGGDRLPLLDPALWPGWIGAVIAVLLAGIALELVAYRSHRWTLPLAVSNGALNLVLVGLVAWVAIEDRLVNPAVLERIAQQGELSQVPTVNAGLVILLVGAVAAWDTFEKFRDTYKATREA